MNARKSVSKLYTAKAHLSSVENNMKAQAAQLKVAGCLKASTDVMKSMQQLVKIPELQKTMQEMSQEMMKVRMYEFFKVIRMFVSIGVRAKKSDQIIVQCLSFERGKT